MRCCPHEGRSIVQYLCQKYTCANIRRIRREPSKYKTLYYNIQNYTKIIKKTITKRPREICFIGCLEQVYISKEYSVHIRTVLRANGKLMDMLLIAEWLYRAKIISHTD